MSTISIRQLYSKRLFQLIQRNVLSIACLLVVVTWPGVERTQAQETIEASKAPVLSFEEKRIPTDAIIAITAWPSRMLKVAGTELFPWEIISAKIQEEVGFDPLTIERVDIVVGLPPIGAMVPSVGALFTLTTDASIEDLSSEIAIGPVDKRYSVDVRQLKEENYFIGSIDGKHHVVGTINYVVSMVKGNGKSSKLSTLCASVKPQSDLTVLIALDPVMPMIEGFVEGQIEMIPPAPAALAKAMVAHAEYIAISADLQQGLGGKSRLVIGSKTEQGAAEISKSWKSTMEFGLAMMKEQMVLPQESEKVQLATSHWLERFVPALKTLITPQQKGKRLMVETTSASMGIPGIGFAVGLLLPAVQAAREAARRMSCSNNIRQLGIAMLNHEYAYKKFPAAAIVDEKTGEPLLSWRVAMLPFLEQQALYDQFKLDEPWDSPHNIELLDKMPAMFKCPSSTIPNGKTTYLAVASEECGLHPTEPSEMRGFSDGTSNSILIVEVADEHAVPWTAPKDFAPSPEAIQKIVGSNHNGGYHVSFCDGSVQFIPQSMDIENLMGLFTRAGGEIVQLP